MSEHLKSKSTEGFYHPDGSPCKPFSKFKPKKFTYIVTSSLHCRCRNFNGEFIKCGASALLDPLMLTVLKLSGEHVCKADPDLKEELQGVTLAHETILQNACMLEVLDLVVSWREQPFNCKWTLYESMAHCKILNSPQTDIKKNRH